MSRIITVSVDLNEFDAALQIDEGIKTLELLKGVHVSPPAPPQPTGYEATPAAVVEMVPAPPPPPPAATTEVAPPPPPAATTEVAPPAKHTGVDLDEEGLPWDGRIHASSKTKIVKGNTWKVKRNTDPALIEKVKAELRATMAAPRAAIVADEPDPVEIFGTTATEAPELKTSSLTFPDVMQMITGRYAANTLQKVDLDNLLAAYELPNIGMLASRPDLFDSFVEDLDAL